MYFINILFIPIISSLEIFNFEVNYLHDDILSPSSLHTCFPQSNDKCTLRLALTLCVNSSKIQLHDCSISLPHNSTNLLHQRLSFNASSSSHVRAIHLIGNGAMISPAVKGDKDFSFLTVTQSVSLHISNVTLTGFNSSLDGGVLHLENITNSTFTDVNFYRNTGSDGGAVYLRNSSYVIFHNCNFTNNNAGDTNKGGAMYVTQSSGIVLDGCMLSGNIAYEGGGLCVDSGVTGVTVSRSVMRKNSAGYGGGGMYVGSANTAVSVVQQTVITDNVAVTAGGGMYIDESNKEISACDSTISANVANVGYGANGGGVFVGSYNRITLNNMTITFNVAGSDGGGIYLDTNVISASITNSLISVNTAMSQYGGGVFVGTSSSVSVHDTEISLNSGNLGGAGICVDIGVDSFSITNSVITSNYNVESGGGLYFAGYGRGNVIHGCVIDHNSAANNGGGVFLSDSNIGMLISNSTITRNSGGTSTTSSGGGIYVHKRNNQLSIIDCVISYNTAVLSGGGILIYDSNMNNSLIRNRIFGNAVTVDRSTGGGVMVDRSNNYFHVLANVIEWNSASFGGGICIGSYNLYSAISTSRISHNVVTYLGGGILLNVFNKYCTIYNSTFSNNTAVFGGGGMSVVQSNDYLSISHCKVYGNVLKNAVNGLQLGMGGGIEFFQENAHIMISDSTIYDNIGGSGGGLSIGSSNIDVKLKGNFFSHNSAIFNGGGIFVSASVLNLVVIDSDVSYNSAVQGGGVYIDHSSIHVVIDNSSIHHNEGRSVGGGLYLDTGCHHFTMKRSSVSHNIAKFGAGLYFYTKINNVSIHGSDIIGNEAFYDGGGIYVDSYSTDFTILRTSLSHNIADFGAGLFVSISIVHVVVRDSIISHNVASFNGGGILLDRGNSDFFCSNNTISKNSCGFNGGGIYFNLNNHDATISHNVIVNNIATMNGGGIFRYSNNDNFKIEYNTISKNMGEFGAGLFFSADNNKTLVNSCEMTGNYGIDGGAIYIKDRNMDVVIINSVISYNIIINNGGGVFVGMNNDRLTIHNTKLIRNVARNGGALYLYRDNYFTTVRSCVISDNIVGIDASLGNGSITRTGGSGGGIFAYYNNDNMSIIHSTLSRNSAVSDGGALYLLASNMMLTVMYCSIVNNIAVNGGGVMLVDGNSHAMIQNSNFEHNVATFGSAISSFASSDHFILSHSLVMGNAGVAQGAVAFSQSQNFSMTYCSFGRNNATMGLGGAVALVNVISGVISDTSLSFNSAANGGAISLDSCQNILFSHCTVLNNVAVTNGGGLYLSSSNTDVVLRDCEFSGNSGADGGAMHIADGNHRLFLTNTVFMSNTATVSGGAISIQEHSNVFQISSSVFIGNSANNGGGIAFGVLIRNVALRHVVFENNVASDSGGAVFILSYADKFLFDNVSYIGNVATQLGGAVLLGDHNTGVVYSGCRFHRNWVTNNDGLGSGGAVFAASSNEISVRDSRFSANVADRGGGAIALFTNHRSFHMSNCVFYNNSVTAVISGGTVVGVGLSISAGVGGAVAVFGTGNSDVNISGCTFRMNQNKIGGGGALFLTDATKVSLSQSSFLGNTASYYGGGVEIRNTVYLTLRGCIFDNNRGELGGGGLYVAGSSGVTIKTTSFTANTVPNDASGSAMFLSQVPSMVVVNNTFRSNSAGNRGTVYWESNLMREPQGLSSSTNKWTGNVAKYGSRYATDLYRITSPSNITAYRYPENNILPTVIVFAFDFYNQAIPFLNTGSISVTLSSTDYKCGTSTGSLVGSTDAVLKDGRAEFKALVGSCYPGGYYNLYFSEPTLANKAVTTVSFPECLIGDMLSATGKCNCPIGAEWCKENDVEVKSGYWRLSKNSYSTIQCPYGPSCLGGNRTGSESCDVGYKGPLCMTCGDGYYISDVSGKCSLCTGSATALSIASVVLSICTYLMFTALVIWYVKELTYNKKKSRLSIVLQNLNAENTLASLIRAMVNEMVQVFIVNIKVIISTLQIVVVIKSIVTVPLSVSLSDFFKAFSWIDSGFFVKLLAVSCSKYRLDHVAQLMYLTMTPIVFAIAWCVTFQIIRITFQQDYSVFVKNIRVHFMYIFLLGSNLILPGVSRLIAQSYFCRDIDLDRSTGSPVYVLRVDPSISCSSDRYTEGVIWASIMMVVYPIGVPTPYEDPWGISKQTKTSSFDSPDYEKKYWYWEVIETIRKLALTAGLSVISNFVGVQLVYGIVVSIAFVKIYGYYRPYESDDTDNLQELCSFQVLLTFFGTMFETLSEDIHSKINSLAILAKDSKDQDRIHKELDMVWEDMLENDSGDASPLRKRLKTMQSTASDAIRHRTAAINQLMLGSFLSGEIFSRTPRASVRKGPLQSAFSIESANVSEGPDFELQLNEEKPITQRSRSFFTFKSGDVNEFEVDADINPHSNSGPYKLATAPLSGQPTISKPLIHRQSLPDIEEEKLSESRHGNMLTDDSLQYDIKTDHTLSQKSYVNSQNKQGIRNVDSILTPIKVKPDSGQKIENKQSVTKASKHKGKKGKRDKNAAHPRKPTSTAKTETTLERKSQATTNAVPFEICTFFDALKKNVMFGEVSIDSKDDIEGMYTDYDYNDEDNEGVCTVDNCNIM
eukprot:gene2061-4027_t